MGTTVPGITVSVCCVTYNHEQYIEETINGFLLQNVDFRIEVLIADDASTDGTQAVIARYGLKYPRTVRVIARKTNLGMMGNYVDAIKQCRGKYVAICEGDDYWVDPYKLQKQVNFLDNNEDYVLSYHNVIAQNVDTSTKCREDVERIFFRVAPEKIPIGHRYHTSSMVFRNVVGSYPKQIFEVVNTGDSFLQFLISRHGKTTFQRDVYPNIRRRNCNSLYSFKSKEEKNSYSILLHKKLLEIAETEEENEVLNKNLLKIYSRRIKLLWRKNERWQSIRCLGATMVEALKKRKVVFFVGFFVLEQPVRTIKRKRGSVRRKGEMGSSAGIAENPY